MQALYDVKPQTQTQMRNIQCRATDAELNAETNAQPDVQPDVQLDVGLNVETDAETGVQPHAELWMQSDTDVGLN